MNSRELCDEGARLLDARNALVAWEARCDECLEELREECRRKRQRTATGAINSLVCNIARLEGLRNVLREPLAHVGAGLPSRFTWTEVDTAFRNRVVTGIVVNKSHIEPRSFLEDAMETVLAKLRQAIATHASVKVNTVFNGLFVAGERTSEKSINTRNRELYPTSDLREWYERYVTDAIVTELEEFQERDSGWALSRILNLMVNINRHNPMRAGCRVAMSRAVRTKRAVVSVQSDDNACFAWAVIAALYPSAKHPERTCNYVDHMKELDLSGIEFPMTLQQIARFERNNDISINVFTAMDKEISFVPLRLTANKKVRHINLLYVPDGREGCPGHFAWIKNLSRLVSSQLSKHNGMKYICDRCLHYFHSNEKLTKHAVDCEKQNDCAIVLPTKGDNHLRFENYNRKERVSMVVYADLECILEKRDEEKTSTYKYQQHRVFSIGYYVSCPYIESAYRSHRGEDCVTWFVDELRKLAHEAKNMFTTHVPMVELTPEEREQFRNATHCHICERPFERDDDTRVRDHCHLTGRYRGPAHSACNLNYKCDYVVPVVFHNMSGYDAHFIIKDVANAYDGKVDLLSVTKESYISFTKHVYGTQDERSKRCVQLRFIDSYKFLSGSLDKLVSYLDKSELNVTRSEFRGISEDDFELLTRKGVFPYEYVDSFERLQETSLPSREAFYSSLSGETVNEKEYAHATNVWQRFGISNLGEYSDLYLKTDVLLLADVFENFRNACVASYGLDPAHYYTLPGYTWDAMLKYTGVTFELLTDIDMVMFVERGVRGGLSQCSNRYARANNGYMSSYDPSEPSSYLMYYDVNNLYGWAMCQPLAFANFQWVENASTFDVTTVPEDSDIGYILEVDIAYPRELHDAHSDLPFCPTRETPPGKKKKRNAERLLATVFDKTSYVIHYRTLQQCMRHGLRLTRIHRVLRFSQSPWLRSYIELNTRFRANATNDFAKNLYKLMNNAVFGKTMENVRKYTDVRLITKWEGRGGAEALIAKPNFHSRSVFAENLMAVELRRLEVRFNKPLYVGMCILDLSKTRLYEFHYEYMAPLYGDKCRIMYTDTDSLIYHIECENVYEDMKRDIARFDTSDYATNNPYGMPRENKKVPGLMKDENNGAIMTEFVGLRAKMYALRVTGKKDTKRAKGVKRNVVARTITFDDYARCLRNSEEQTRRQSCIRSRLHEVFTVSEEKLALSSCDDKRYIIDGSTDTLPWGHYRIPIDDDDK